MDTFDSTLISLIVTVLCAVVLMCGTAILCTYMWCSAKESGSAMQAGYLRSRGGAWFPRAKDK